MSSRLYASGVFAVSRALGDFEMKNPDKAQDATVMTAAGDVSVLERAGCEFFVIACDGIWDVMSSEEVSKFVNWRLETGQTPVEVRARAGVTPSSSSCCCGVRWGRESQCPGRCCRPNKNTVVKAPPRTHRSPPAL